MIGKKPAPLLAGFMLLSLVLSACAGLPSEEETAAADFGPGYSIQEHQVRTFDALWGHLQDEYVYFDGENLDWESIHDKYRTKITNGLTSEEFAALLNGLESELPNNSLMYQPRAERIETAIADLSTYLSRDD